MRCPSCSAEVPATAACSACGAPLPSAAGQRVAAVLGTTAVRSSLRYQLVGGSAFACARVELAPNQSVRAEGTALLSSHGAIVHRPVPAGARYVVDTGNIVAFDARMPYQVRKASRRGWLRSILSGESLVAEFTGPGELWLQTRNLQGLAGALFPLFPNQQQGGGGGLGHLFGN